MRNVFAKIIVYFSHLITFPFFGPARRADVQLRAGSTLVECGKTEVNTKSGRLIFTPAARLNYSSAQFMAHEPDTMEWIQAFTHNVVYWDIGANVGVFALYAGLKPGVRVLAFEPAAGSFSVLNRNIELNSIDRITAYCIAFAGETKLDSLNMSDTSPGGAMHGFDSERDQFNQIIDVKFRQGAVGFSVDNFVETFSPPRPTHVKIDVDGIEAEILRGGQETFSAPSVRSMIIEIEGDMTSHHNREILQQMVEFGFAARPKASPHLRNVVFDRNRVL